MTETHTIVSIGMSCQTRHQIEQYATRSKNRPALVKCYFDWLICPPDSFSALLGAGIPALRRDALEVRNGHAYWPEFDVYFWHDFLNKNGAERTCDIDANWERSAGKIEALAERFRALDPAHTTFVFSNTQNNLDGTVFEKARSDRYMIGARELTDMQTSLDAFFGSRCDMLVLSRKDRFHGTLDGNAPVSMIKLDATEWKGDQLAWDAALARHFDD